MNLFKSLIGRRKFLVAATAASASAMTYKKLTGVIDPILQTSAAMASEKSAISDMKGILNKRYSNFLSPLKIGNVALKSRMMHTQSLPHFFQGPETFPSEHVISHYASVARNGAAVVTCWSADIISLSDGELRNRKELKGDLGHNPMWDAANPGVQNYLSQLADAIHFYDSKASIGVRVSAPQGYSISNAPIPGAMMGMGNSIREEIPVELIQKMIEDAVADAKFYQSLGFDMVDFHMSYRNNILAHVLSPVLNERTDRYGGSLENRARLALELFQAIKKACGQDFLIAAHISGEEGSGGYTVNDAVQFAKVWEGSADILELRAPNATAAHPMGWNSEKGKPLTLHYAEAIKKSGAKIVTAPVGGYQDLDLNEEFVATGKTDMIGMARSFICDPDYGIKAYEGRGEDVVPCIRCNKCHGETITEGPWLNICSVNPKLGIAHRINRMIAAPRTSKKVAVIGGGPAGMRAAIIAAERGHKVTLYEKNDYLGGLLRHADFSPFKWPLKDFKDYLIRQVNKLGVEVLLRTKATPDMIRKKGFDALLVATGTEIIIPKIPGADGINVWNVTNVYGNEKALGKNIVVIGGGHGADIGGYLAQAGHKVTVLASGKELVKRGGPHQDTDYQNMDNFSFILEATTTRISNGKVTYVNAKGNEKSINADSVVIYAGFKPRLDEAMKFSGSADRFFMIGDCSGKAGDVRKCNRMAFAAASQI